MHDIHTRPTGHKIYIHVRPITCRTHDIHTPTGRTKYTRVLPDARYTDASYRTHDIHTRPTGRTTCTRVLPDAPSTHWTQDIYRRVLPDARYTCASYRTQRYTDASYRMQDVIQMRPAGHTHRHTHTHSASYRTHDIHTRPTGHTIHTRVLPDARYTHASYRTQHIHTSYRTHDISKRPTGHKLYAGYTRVLPDA